MKPYSMRPDDQRDEDDKSVVSAEENHDKAAEDRRIKALKTLQMDDLGTARREYVTSHDKVVPMAYRKTQAQLSNARVVNEEGTHAATSYQQNHAAINAWNTSGGILAEDVKDKEQFSDIMGGQAHRAKLNDDIEKHGGQEYGEKFSFRQGNHMNHQGRGGMMTRGIAGRSGRGAPMHMRSGDRPLDPAIDPNRLYGYKSRSGGKSVLTPFKRDRSSPKSLLNPFQRNQSTSTMTPSKVGRPSNDARVGSGSHGHAAHSGPVRTPPPAARVPGPPTPFRAPQQQGSPVNLRAQRPRRSTEHNASLLQEDAFLLAMRQVGQKQQVAKGPQPSPNHALPSLTAALRTLEHAESATNPQVGPVPGAGNHSKKTYQKDEMLKLAQKENPLVTVSPAGSQIKKTDQKDEMSKFAPTSGIRLAPVSEICFPPPVSKSLAARKGSNHSVFTDGVETGASFHSADFSRRTESQAGSKLVTEHEARQPQVDHHVAGPDDNDDAKRAETTPGSGSRGLPFPSVHQPEMDLLPAEQPEDVRPRSISYQGAKYIRQDLFTHEELDDAFLRFTIQNNTPFLTEAEGNLAPAFEEQKNIPSLLDEENVELVEARKEVVEGGKPQTLREIILEPPIQNLIEYEDHDSRRSSKVSPKTLIPPRKVDAASMAPSSKIPALNLPPQLADPEVAAAVLADFDMKVAYQQANKAAAAAGEAAHQAAMRKFNELMQEARKQFSSGETETESLLSDIDLDNFGIYRSSESKTKPGNENKKSAEPKVTVKLPDVAKKGLALAHNSGVSGKAKIDQIGESTKSELASHKDLLGSLSSQQSFKPAGVRNFTQSHKQAGSEDSPTLGESGAAAVKLKATKWAQPSLVAKPNVALQSESAAGKRWPNPTNPIPTRNTPVLPDTASKPAELDDDRNKNIIFGSRNNPVGVIKARAQPAPTAPGLEASIWANPRHRPFPARRAAKNQNSPAPPIRRPTPEAFPWSDPIQLTTCEKPLPAQAAHGASNRGDGKDDSDRAAPPNSKGDAVNPPTTGRQAVERSIQDMKMQRTDNQPMQPSKTPEKGRHQSLIDLEATPTKPAGQQNAGVSSSMWARPDWSPNPDRKAAKAERGQNRPWDPEMDVGQVDNGKLSPAERRSAIWQMNQRAENDAPANLIFPNFNPNAKSLANRNPNVPKTVVATTSKQPVHSKPAKGLMDSMWAPQNLASPKAPAKPSPTPENHRGRNDNNTGDWNDGGRGRKWNDGNASSESEL